MKKIKTIWLILIGLLFSITIFSQTKRFSMTIEYSPNLSGITDEVVNEKYKISHNAVLRIEYKTNTKIQPTIGLGFLNTGKFWIWEVRAAGIDEFNFINNYNYIIIPIGAKINLGRFYFLPEIGFGLNFSNKTKRITKYTNGEIEKETIDEKLNSEEFNRVSIPILIGLGKEFQIGGKSFEVGVKGYYGLNNVVKDVPRNNHYYGFGFLFGILL